MKTLLGAIPLLESFRCAQSRVLYTDTWSNYPSVPKSWIVYSHWRDNIVTINRAWNRSASFRLTQWLKNNTPHDKVILPLLLHKWASNFQSLCSSWTRTPIPCPVRKVCSDRDDTAPLVNNCIRFAINIQILSDFRWKSRLKAIVLNLAMKHRLLSMWVITMMQQTIFPNCWAQCDVLAHYTKANCNSWHQHAERAGLKLDNLSITRRL